MKGRTQAFTCQKSDPGLVQKGDGSGVGGSGVDGSFSCTKKGSPFGCPHAAQWWCGEPYNA